MKEIIFDGEKIELRRFNVLFGDRADELFNFIIASQKSSSCFYFPETGRTQKNQVRFVLNIIKENGHDRYIIRTESDIITASFRAAVNNGYVKSEEIIFLDVNEWLDRYFIYDNGSLSDYPDYNLGEVYSKLLDVLLSKDSKLEQVIT